MNPKRIWVCLIAAVFLAMNSATANAGNLHGEQYETVFLIDCSQTMEETDQGNYIADFMQEMTAVLPRHYRVGMVAYQTEVLQTLALGASPAEVEASFEGISYRGYTNTGAALESALGLFSQDPGTVRKVAIVSDGEISMKTKADTEAAAELFGQSLQAAKESGITVDIITLGEKLFEENNIYQAAEATGGKRYSLESAEALADFATGYLLEECKIPYISVGKISGQTASLMINLPDNYMDRAKIFLLGKQTEANTDVACKADSIKMETGNGYTVITLENPLEREVAVQMASEQDMDVQAYLTAEYTISLRSDSSCTAEIPPVPVEGAMEEAAGEGAAPITYLSDIELDVLNPDGNSLLSGHLQESRGFQVALNGNPYEYTWRDNILRLQYPVLESESVDLQVSLPVTYASYYGDGTATENIEVPPVEEPEPEPETDWFLYAVITLLALCLAIILLWAKKKRRPGRKRGNISARKVMVPLGGDSLPAETEHGRYDFCGKVSAYILQAGDGIEYPPATLNLAARCGRKTITLQWILDACDIQIEPDGADRILFMPGEDRSLLVKNNSKATALKGRDVLLKSHQYPVRFHEKVTFIFGPGGTDETGAEIEIHYKDLKINER